MLRQEWIDLARALGRQRARVAASWPPKGGYMANAPDVHERRLIRAAKLEAIDIVARNVARVLKQHSGRFDATKFLFLVGVDRE